MLRNDMDALTNAVYLVAIVLFILGLKGLGSPKTARQGNRLASLAMLLAVAVTLLDQHILDFTTLIAGLVIGAGIGALAARKVQMTAMPQMVAVLNGLGGAASALVALSEYLRLGNMAGLYMVVTISLSLLIGSVTFSGSLVAFGKLQGLVRGTPIVLPLHRAVNVLLLTSCVFAAGAATLGVSALPLSLCMVFLASMLGILFVLPIGGADMPVVISLLNSYSGLAAACTGFVLSNEMLIVAGALVGASGIILTRIMCKAMNRSLRNVLFGTVSAARVHGPAGVQGQKQVTGYEPDDVAMMFESAQSLIIVPGYGLAVSQAQHVVHELETLLSERGVRVSYAIHPVAGRMPGHMNVLLAEANVSYDLLFTMEEINKEFTATDVVLVVGANDIINPVARTLEGSPLYGMPILNVDQARAVIIVKRSLSPGFAGVDNELFYNPKTMMVFQDAKKALTQIVNLMKE